MLSLRRDVLAAQALEGHVREGGLLGLADSTAPTYERARSLAENLLERHALKAEVLAGGAWLGLLEKRSAELAAEDPLRQALVEVRMVVQELEHERHELVPKAIQAPDDAERNQDVRQAIARLIGGQRPFPWLSLGKSQAQAILGQVRVGARAPSGFEDWRLLEQMFAWREQAYLACSKWRAIRSEFDLPELPQGLEEAFRALVRHVLDIERARRLALEFEAPLRGRLAKVFGARVVERLSTEGESFVALAQKSLQAHVDKNRLAYAKSRIQTLVQELGQFRGTLAEHMRAFFATSLLDPGVDEQTLEHHWQALRDDLKRLYELAPELGAIEFTANAIEAAGAPKWAARIRTEPAGKDSDPVVPSSWLEAWRWGWAVSFLASISGHRELHKLFEDRTRFTRKLAAAYEKVVAEKAWLKVNERCTGSVKQALAAYLNAVRSMGKGTGVRSARHRKDARAAMDRAYPGVSCWVLPQWRVSEAIPATLGLFDLVVIDEASQSDIKALPVLLRGQKVLVVGDDKQVSPEAIGVSGQTIDDLRRRFLSNQPHAPLLAQDKSIYDLASVVFADNAVMLREHFRSVPAIIEFSNKHFYGGDIQPLRVPKANERLDPPLVDVFVKGGTRSGDVNKAEAKAVVDEIVTIIADPALEGRSIGVVTLLGRTHAAHIHELLNRHISHADILKRDIAVGPPAVFQGRERDLMLVSLVVDGKRGGVSDRLSNRQRFNVALSRARDRMYLFRSVTDQDVSSSSLAGLVLAHFKSPLSYAPRQLEDLRALCDSPFESDMFDALVAKGYRVQPQVPCAGRRIDLVVEGANGRRLAVECDGDRYHGPERWDEDMKRQRILERAGWTFWRSFYSSFVLQREEVLENLVETLKSMGIEPLGGAAVDNTAWVLQKVADPFGVGRDDEDDEDEEDSGASSDEDDDEDNDHESDEDDSSGPEIIFDELVALTDASQSSQTAGFHVKVA